MDKFKAYLKEEKRRKKYGDQDPKVEEELVSQNPVQERAVYNERLDAYFANTLKEIQREKEEAEIDFPISGFMFPTEQNQSVNMGDFMVHIPEGGSEEEEEEEEDLDYVEHQVDVKAVYQSLKEGELPEDASNDEFSENESINSETDLMNLMK